jgi:hypothetical protein
MNGRTGGRSRGTTRLLVAWTVGALFLVTSCSRDRDDERREGGPNGATANDDIRIQTTSTELDLALVGDTISAGLTPRALAKVHQETDTARVSGSGLGSSIERMVKTTVQSAVSSRVRFPVSAVKDVRYEDGAIRFEWHERPTQLLEQTKVNGKPFLESFAPDDARRFVDAVRARIPTNR